MMYINESGLQFEIHNWIDWIPVKVDTEIVRSAVCCNTYSPIEIHQEA